ncbi:MAG: hypothetical protein K2N06_01865 [Oscillospiraceae bacterium]|nr:hypothetical protein [Oscillospiraceae bacterium]
MEKTFSKSNKFKLLFLALYFVILTVERVISLVVCFAGDMSRLDWLDYYMIALTILAIFGAYIFIVVRFSKKSDSAKSESAFGDLAIAAGILLLGGMVHTEGSIPPIQFASYGMILVSMAIHTAQNVKHEKNPDKKWLSFAYIVAFSMAIPVVYHTSIELSYLFIPIEIIVSLGMVLLFTDMLRRFYLGNGESSFSMLPFMIALFGDFAVLVLRWQEYVNTFVLIFICVTTVLWFAGNVLCIKRK